MWDKACLFVKIVIKIEIKKKKKKSWYIFFVHIAQPYSKWKVFEPWCLVYAVDPVSCPVCSVLEFLQDKFLAGVAATTLRVYVAAIAARRDSDDVQLGRHHLVSSFMRGVKRLRPLRPPSFPSWDLSVVLNGLLEPPFDPLESAFLRILTRYSFVGIGLAWACGRSADSVC